MLDIIRAAKAKARKVHESLYEDSADVIEYQKKTKANKSVWHEEVMVIHGQPCKLHVSRSSSAAQTDTVAAAPQTVSLHLAPEITINPNSKLAVTHKGITTEYKNSGVPEIFDTHQEVMLEIFNGWA